MFFCCQDSKHRQRQRAGGLPWKKRNDVFFFNFDGKDWNFCSQEEDLRLKIIKVGRENMYLFVQQ